MFTGGGGGINFLKPGTKDQTVKDEKGSISYYYAGASVGIDGGPDAGFSYSDSDMWSGTIGNLRARDDTPLTVDDFTGPMLILSVSATSTVVMQGMSMTAYMLGCPALLAIGSVAFPPALLALASTAAQHAKAIGVSVGRIKGADTSISVAAGYARRTATA